MTTTLESFASLDVEALQEISAGRIQFVHDAAYGLLTAVTWLGYYTAKSSYVGYIPG